MVCESQISSFSDVIYASRILRIWRLFGADDARAALFVYASSPLPFGPLLQELSLRLAGAYSPRIVIDGLWFTQLFGGITRVWSNIFSTFSLPGFITSNSPLYVIRRENKFHFPASVISVAGSSVDPIRSIPFILCRLSCSRLLHH